MTMEEFLNWYENTFYVEPTEPNLLLSYTHIIPITATALYLLLVFAHKARLPAKSKDAKPKETPKKEDKPRKEKKGFTLIEIVMASWNLFLTIFSFLVLVGVGIPFGYHIYTRGFKETICDDPPVLSFNRSSMLFWCLWFAYSKYFELFDTVLKIIKNPDRDVDFLHWFHHATVLLFTWYAEYNKYTAGICFIVMNAFIHTFMYYYYFLKTLGYNPWWDTILTIGQISQMVFGIIFNGSWVYMYFVEKRKCSCENFNVMVVSCALMYGAYLFLFLKFFVKRYITSKPKKKAE